MEVHETFVSTTRALGVAYNDKTPMEKYANVSQYMDFKRGVWDVNHEHQNPPESWFVDANGAEEEEEEDDDLVMGKAIQSLKCPITLMFLEKPVRNTLCPHVYSLDAIKELVRQGRGSCECPVPGCDAHVTMAGVKEDKGMARKVRQERAREEEREALGGRDAEAVGDETEIYGEDDDVKEE
jgi:SUMO ligase MMS21 Smc5/6 complex component